MKYSLWLFLILCCLILAACEEPTAASESGAQSTSIATTAATEAETPEKPEEIIFQVSCICELTDPEGKTLHCGGPYDFHGTIDGTPDRVYGTNPSWFEFSVPYREYYRFEVTKKKYLLDCNLFHSSRISAEGPQEVIWKPSGWEVKSTGSDVNLLLNCGDQRGGGFLAVLDFHTDADADIVLTKDSISVSGASGEAAVHVFDIKTMKSSEDQVIPVRGGALKIDLSTVPAGTVKITADGESSDLALVWDESD